MASDDGLAKDGETDESSAPRNKPRKKTIRGMGVQVSRPPDLPDASGDDDFAAEATEIAESLADDVISDIDQMLDDDVDAGWDKLADATRTGGFIAVDEDERPARNPGAKPPPLSDGQRAATSAPSDTEGQDDFEVEATEIAVSSLSFPEDERSGDGTFADAVSGDEGLSALDLAEDSLPEAIHEKTPTFDEKPPADRSFTSIDIPDQGPPGDGELPEPIRSPEASPVAFRGDPSEEDGFDGDKTELLDSPFESEPAVARLVVLDGPASGQEFFASGLRNSVGRGVNNSIVVADLAMSRQHFEIVKNPDETYAIHDLQSVNGTVLNGTKIREADLLHGDRIVAGKSTFQFVVSGGGAPANRKRNLVPAAMSTVSGASPKLPPGSAPGAAKSDSVNRLIVWVSLGAAVVSLFLIAGIVLLMVSREDAPDQTAPEGPTASQVYLEGVEAVRERNWDSAQSQFERARELDPSLDGIDDQLRRIVIERKAAQNLEEARSYAASGELETAAEHVEEIPRDSVYYSEGRELLREGRRSELHQMFLDAQEALTNEDLERSQTLVDAILEEVPTHQGARELRERIQSVEQGEDTVEEVAAATARAAKKRKKRRRRPRRKRRSNDEIFGLVDSSDNSSGRRRSGSSKAGRVPNFVEGYMLYKSRKFDDAQSFFQKVADDDNPASSLAKKVAGNIASFERHYTAGTAAFKSGNWRVAERELIAAKRADSAIASGQGYFDRELSTKLATVKANLGISALDGGKPAQARRYLDQARNFNSEDPAVGTLEAALEKEAASLWIKARHLQKTDRARAAEHCRDIMQLVPKGHPSHTKARELLKAL